ncbi:MAG: hypothetical protein HQK88_09540 [Nitrospirae bacterium]|nr:hypothetical protein [Nitrospirota bacterium]MBF0534153.1 hypothetical protein [Nitrospirota bacterium]MBF0617040.1 hypothetical protein [Nitrospirota bacterium]
MKRYSFIVKYIVLSALIVLLPVLSLADFMWSAKTTSGSRNWYSIASSSDGKRLAAVVRNGYIYTSTNSGASWTAQTNAGSRNWYSITSSSDGTKLTAGVWNGYIYTSADSGATWTEQTNAGSRDWNSISSSSDGTKLAAVDEGGAIGYIYTSTDSGATWTQRTSAGSTNWCSITSSSDGTKLATTVCSSSGYIYTSTDSGATWDNQTSAGSRYWSSIASSSDGTKLAAVDDSPGYIYTSTDSGATWTEQTSADSRYWQSIASSSDGTKLAAGDLGGYIYTSTDSGVTWTEQTSAGSRGWYSIASSSDGTKLAAVDEYGSEVGGYIYTGSQPSTVKYNLPYLHTNTNNVVYCVATNLSSEDMNVSFTVESADNDTLSTGIQTFTNYLSSQTTRLFTFQEKTASIYSPVTGTESLDLSSDIANSGSYGGSLTFVSTGVFSSGTQASCSKIMISCLQGYSEPRRPVTGYVCIDSVSTVIGH